ncbi:MAG: hypothetical protein OXG37_13690 [Actinomycetia bacterium]|nr:hypothetical protein [Actinomycetes bacterium]
MGVRLGIDTGGTFTDFAAVDEAGRFRVFKTPTTPRAPEQAVFAGIQALAEEAGVSVGGFLADVDLIVHGTTIATNAVIQRTGSKVGILHTDGFRDTLFLRDGFKPDRYNLHPPPPDPLIPRYLRLGVQERLLYTEEVLTPLDETSLRETLKTFARAGVESIAVCLLWSFVNPAREPRAADIIAQDMPDTYVALNSDVLPALREYPRACATTLSAYVGPVLGPYLTKVAVYLAENGYRHDLLIMQVTGGSARSAEAEKRPVLAVGFGPAAGPAACARSACSSPMSSTPTSRRIRRARRPWTSSGSTRSSQSSKPAPSRSSSRRGSAETTSLSRGSQMQSTRTSSTRSSFRSPPGPLSSDDGGHLPQPPRAPVQILPARHAGRHACLARHRNGLAAQAGARLEAGRQRRRDGCERNAGGLLRGVRRTRRDAHLRRRGARPAAVVAGPAVAELPTSMLVVFPRHTLTANPYGDFHIEIPQDGG